MTTAHFQNPAVHIIEQLQKAQTSIHIAVCWFSHPGIYQCILNKLKMGLHIELLLEFDSQNFIQGGLNFRHFILLGGQLYGYRAESLMHHKFAIVDQKLLLTGSFNWTNSANAENIVLSNDPNLMQNFWLEFHRLKCLSHHITHINKTALKGFSTWQLMESTQVNFEALRKHISLGGKIWLLHRKQPTNHHNALYFDAQNALFPYWKKMRFFEKDSFNAFVASADKSAVTQLKKWGLKIQKNDLVLLPNEGAWRPALIRSDAMPSDLSGFGARREIQFLTKTRVLIPDLKTPPAFMAPQAFKGSALQLLQGLFFQ